MAEHTPYQAPEFEDADTGHSPWMRGLFMFLFILVFAIAETLLAIIAILQFFWVVFTKGPNKQLRAFGYSLSIWMRDVAQFQACETEEKPFPFAPWPKDTD